MELMIACVGWVDASQDGNNTETYLVGDDLSIPMTISSGYLVSESKDKITIARDCFFDNGNVGAVRGRLSIPRKMIVSMLKIKIGGK